MVEAAPRPDVLTDRFGRRHTYLRVSLTERCNLRCRYCMPAEGVPLAPREAALTTPELVCLVRLFAEHGVTKVRLTGGEPLARKDAADVAEAIGALPGVETLALTTNGLLLDRHFDRLRVAGLRQLNISLDTLRADRFRWLTRRDGLATVRDAIDRALDEGYGLGEGAGRTLKVNCVVMRGVNDDELGDFAAWASEVPLEVRFIEFMPFGGNDWARDTLVPFREMRARVEERVALDPLDGAPDDTAQTFAVRGGVGRVGFIASMTAPFCAGCTRLRLTADGALKVCLFGGEEASLRDLIRAGANDAEVVEAIHMALQRKEAAHGGRDGADALAAAARRGEARPMILIGG